MAFSVALAGMAWYQKLCGENTRVTDVVAAVSAVLGCVDEDELPPSVALVAVDDGATGVGKVVVGAAVAVGAVEGEVAPPTVALVVAVDGVFGSEVVVVETTGLDGAGLDAVA